MLKWIKKKAALVWAKKHTQQATLDQSKAIEHQEALWRNLVKTAEKTLFGRSHNFDEIKTLEDFQNQVPIADYEDLKPYIEKVKRGQANILWTDTPEYFAKTSGTTSGAKYIPISKEGMPYQIKAAQSALFHYISKKNNADFVNGKMIFLQGSPELEEINGIKTGRLSGIVAHHIPKYLQKNRLPSYETNCIEDWETKVNKIADETETQNMTLISGIPPWLIMYFEILVERHRKKIKQLFPNLQLIVTGGVNYEPYREKMEELLGGSVDIVQTFPASEGFFAFQDDYTQEGLRLLTNNGIFYEFVPLEQYGKSNAPRLTLKDIELNQDYAMILTTNSGLWAYSIGDVVRFISKNPYRILVSGRTKHYTSAFGEHVIAYEVEEAMKSTVTQHYAQITEFHLAPQVTPPNNELPYHEWFIEFEKEPKDLEAFRLTLDQELRARNTYYDDLIEGKVLQPLKISKLKRNAFHEYAKSEGKLGGQNKIPRLANDRKIADFLVNHII
ncbi:GH3 auxin-responsive promoter family protein [Riemerella anatipestifer]|uniref:GH3 auxin-responsive promoter family protein n=1 Tax=Riemerella anatipestifer TaxID=34085 RepID=UPI0007ECF43A|nr:GH3 auxin-responsive promoter family protein [Riemerella anatipestifer]MBT0534074.1 GH3 auxin-responsive promoter family protein [Riemerella anatipestifer]MBT0535860.1 GH3 auxin-responsive promoter family protein [Riemerella anatipestifer]MBT0540085.1 GH3 auxin-responsive promoter family protein [Riemerella anatipestifer]MBT0543946.1 GH3 auxin-responsive promoter family protein [Riemerella anatipestifer]MBT0545913.1 GH3 auxin-responsive promoter family protein [Riemerella anatipestifer]